MPFFQDFSRLKLRFFRKVIDLWSKCFRGGGGGVEIVPYRTWGPGAMYFFLISRILPIHFHFFSISRSGNLCSHFPGFPECVGTLHLGKKPVEKSATNKITHQHFHVVGRDHSILPYKLANQ